MKSLFKQLTITMLLVLPLSMPAFAYDKKDEQMIKQDINKMLTAIDDGKYSVFVELMPEPFLRQLAKQNKLSLQKTKEMMTMGAEMMGSMDMTFEVHTNKIKPHQSSTGRDFAFIPTTTTVDEITVNGKMLAIKDNQKWYYLQYQPEHKLLIQRAYPDIKKLP